MRKKKLQSVARSHSTVELLEARLLYSAESIGAWLPLLDETLETAPSLSLEHLFPEALQTGQTNALNDATLNTIALNDVLVSLDFQKDAQFINSEHAEPTLLPEHVAITNDLIIIDSSLPDSQQLIDSVSTGNSTLIVINPDENGIYKITKSLLSLGVFDSVNIFSHGSQGVIQLGNTSLDINNLNTYHNEISSWSKSLTGQGIINIYGCDVASGAIGEELINTLSELTQATVAASIDLTGHTSLGGDWQLEFTTQPVKDSLASTQMDLRDWQHTLATIIVDTVDDQFTIPAGTTMSELLTLQANSGEVVSLREAVHASYQGTNEADTIILGANIYTLSISGNDDSTLQGDLDVRQDLTIRGSAVGGTAIQNQVSSSRVFELINSSLTLEYITVYDGNESDEGGGIYTHSGTDLTIRDSTVTNNTSVKQGAGIYAQGNVTIERSAITDNQSDDEGGGIYSEGTLTITDSSILNNTAKKWGGGVHSLGDYTITGTEIRNNTTTDESGGGVYGEGSGTLNTVTAWENNAKKDGAALYGTGNIIVNNSTFTQNVAESDGGAIYSNNTMTIEDSVFVTNTADNRGGAIMAKDTLTINRAYFASNDASTQKGGAIFHEANGLIAISNTTFFDNTSDEGGAIVSKMGGSIIHSTFVDNRANSKAAAIWAEGGTITIDSSLFRGNEFRDGTQNVLDSVSSTKFNLFDYNEPVASSKDLNNTDPGVLTLNNTAARVNAFHLAANSPAINAGQAEGNGAIDAQNRERDNISDIGASEYFSKDAVVFFTDNNGGIYRSNTIFSNVQPILNLGNAPGRMAVDAVNDRLYYLNQAGDALNWASFDGESSGVLPIGMTFAQGIAVDVAAGHLYIAYSGSTPKIDRHNLATGALEQTLATTGISQPTDFAINTTTDRLVWSESGFGAESIRSIDLNGNNLQVHTATVNLHSIDLDENTGQLYYTEQSTDSINSINLNDNSSGALTPTLLNNPTAIAYNDSNNSAIWSSDTDDSLYAYNLNNSSRTASYLHTDAINDIALLQTRSASTNAVPTVTSNVWNLSEGDTATLSNAVLNSNDADNTDSELTYTVNSQPLEGILRVNGVANPTQFTQAQVNAGSVTYSHDGSSTPTSDVIKLTLGDGSYTSGNIDLAMSIAPVNDAPSLTVQTNAITPVEGDSHLLAVSMFTILDEDNTTADYVYRYTNDLLVGRIEVNGSVINKNETFTHAQLAADQVVYWHDGGETHNDTIDFIVSDGTTDSNTSTLNVQAIARNDDPTLNTASGTTDTNEGDVLVLTTSHIMASDVDNNSADFNYRFVNDLTNGRIEVAGTELAKNATFSHAQLLAGSVAYRHDGGLGSSEAITFVVSDGNADSNNATLNLAIQPVNDAPVLTILNSPANVNEGGLDVIGTANLSVTDEDNPNSDFLYRYTNDLSSGVLELGGVPLAKDTTFTHAQVTAGDLVYRHNGSEPSTETIDFVVSDGVADSNTGTLTISVNPVNDAPSLTILNSPANVNEGGLDVIGTSNLSATDEDNPNTDFLYRYTNDLSSGVLELGGVPLAKDTTFTHAQVTAGDLVYRHNGSEPSTETIDFIVSDGVADSNTGTLTISVNPVNDAPVLTILNSPANVNEGGLDVIGTSNLSVTDEDNPNTDFLYRYTNDLSSGVLELGGVPLAKDTTFTHAQVTAGDLVYRHNGSEPSTETIDFVVSDGVADSNTGTLTISVNPVNDAPVLLPTDTAIAINEGSSSPLSTTDLLTTDADNTSSDFEYRYTSDLTTGQITVNSIDLPKEGIFTFEDLEDGLVVYHHDGSENRTEVIAFVVSDGQLDSTAEPLSYVVQPINDAPELSTSTTNIELDEGGLVALSISDLVASDTDTPNTEWLFRFDSDLQAGAIEVEGAILSRNMPFTYDQLLSGQVAYRHDGSEQHSESIEFFLSDGELDSNSVVLSFLVSPVNDSPSLAVFDNIALLDEGKTFIFSADQFTASDVDNLTQELSYRVEETVKHGHLLLNEQTLSSGDQFTHQNLENGALSYQHDGSETRVDSLTLVATDLLSDSSRKTVNIDITAVNDQPVVTVGETTVLENLPGAKVADIIAIDPDAGDVLTYRVSDNRFIIEEETLKLNEGVALDYETESLIDLQLSVTDLAGATNSIEFTVQVEDVNDAPEVLVQPEADRGDGYIIPKDTFIDLDGDQITISAKLGDGEALPDWITFNEESGQFQVVNYYKQSPELEVVLTAEDGRGGSTEVPVVLYFDPDLGAATPDLPDTPNLPTPINQPTSNEPTPVTKETPEPAPTANSTPLNNQASIDEFVNNTSRNIVDIQSLVTPVAKFGSLELAAVSNGASSEKITQATLSMIENEIDSLNLSAFFITQDTAIQQTADNLSRALNSKDVTEVEQLKLSQQMIGSTAGLSTGFSVGYLLWLIRGGTLMGSVLSSLPAWRFVDPLPVLSTLGDGFDDDDDETLESMVSTEKEATHDQSDENPSDPAHSHNLEAENKR